MITGTGGFETVRSSTIFPKDTVRLEADFDGIKFLTLEKCSITIDTLKGVSPPPPWLP